jgi:CheY-like chemotaxis protein
VLVVDDERTTAVAIQKLLRLDVPEVEVAQGGYEALAIFDHHELLIVDVSMPGMGGGFRGARRAREARLVAGD